MHVITELNCQAWNSAFSPENQRNITAALESGQVIHCPELAFQLLPHEEKFLSPECAGKNAKNISYNPTRDLLSNTACSQPDHDALKSMLKRFGQSAQQLIHQLFPQYIPFLKIGRTSFRPVEIAGRKSSYRKDDTRLHVDAFPATPNQGARILRVFANINPHGQNREWRIGEPFADIAQRFLPQVARHWPAFSSLLKKLKITKTYRTHYDHIMLHIHNLMKADLDYQKNSPQIHFSIAPNTSWIVQTDHVSHAAMSGQHALEQTFYLPVNAMVKPELSPLKVLENILNQKLN